MRPAFLAIMLCLTASICSAQGEFHEYRTEVVITSPRVHGFGALFVLDERLAMADLAPNEVNVGGGVISPQYRHVSAAVEIRHVKTLNGRVEVRYVPTLYFNIPLPAGFELRDRNRFEIRDIEGTWSRRYVNRTAVGHDVWVAGHSYWPYAQSDTYLDVRSHDVTRFDATGGVRTTVLHSGTSVDFFAAHGNDRTRTPHTGITAGMVLRVQL